MSHQSLYRRYRPQNFSELIGQEVIAQTLAEQIKSGAVGHAYLFAGSRGLGKTSVARIFARELGTTDRDLYEIDAASHNGVDYIRELSENIYTLPFESRYKIFILDEAHMLSKGAWNAFLKTLEEPPAYAIFILATTELEKIPDTVQSRCQVFTFKKPTRSALALLIGDVAKKEGYRIEPDAAELLALLADGSYRDALSVLEKTLTVSTNKTLTREEAEQATGAPKQVRVLALVEALGRGDGGAALATLHAASAEDVDMVLFLTLVLEALRSILLIRHAPELRGELEKELGGESYSEHAALAQAKDSLLTHETLRVFLDAASRIRFAPIPSLPLELAVLEVTHHADNGA